MYYDIPDSFYIKVFNVKTSKCQWIYFDNRQAKSDTSKYSIYEKSDLYISEIKLPKDFEIKTINKYFKNPKSDSLVQPISAFSFGYSNSAPLSFDELLSENPNMSSGKIKGIINSNTIVTKSNEFERLNYVINLDSETIRNLKGISGCPIFLDYGKSKVFFGGLAFAGVNNSIFIVRPKYIYQEILRLLQKHM